MPVTLTDRGTGFYRRPLSTYRLQLGPSFGFEAAAGVVPYLHALGITDLYLSPILRAASGSPHGYDVVDHSQLNPELGGDAGFERLASSLAERGMGCLVDVVPNHMAIGPENALWMDVLENGPSSIHAHVFDIDWHPLKEELENRVLVPVLGAQYGEVLERGGLPLVFEQGCFMLDCPEASQRFPIAPRSYGTLLRHGLEEGAAPAGVEPLHQEEFLSILHALELLPSRLEQDPKALVDRHREKEVIKRRLAALVEASGAIGEHIARVLAEFNRTPDLLDALLRQQAYRPASWRVAAEEINYRRFFDVNGLAAIRMDDARVRSAAHAKLFELLLERKITGLRIDHPDGLFDPAEYLAALQDEFVAVVASRQGQGVLEVGTRPVYVVVEKILVGGEKLPSDWATDGTTGYEVMDALNGLFVDPRGRRPIDEGFTRFTREKLDYAELVHEKRLQTMLGAMASEVGVLARQLARLAELDRRTRDFTLGNLRFALIETIASFPAYRSYLRREGGEAEGADRDAIEWAVRRARRRRQTINASIFDFVRDVLLGRAGPSPTDELRAGRRDFVMKAQQVMAPVMAKSVEDCAFYVYNRLVSLNEVGGEPDRFGMDPESFRTFVAQRARSWPAAMNATSTHDTKRSEDVRARIDVLSELALEWRRSVVGWARLNRRHKIRVGDEWCPSPNEEWLFYQTLLGVLPPGATAPVAGSPLRSRLVEYMLKAIREAKVHTSWVNPNEAWERGTQTFIEAALDSKRSTRFWEGFSQFHDVVGWPGAVNSLGMVVLKLTLPGVADLYQGTESWAFTLVDPDNRTPLDFAALRETLSGIDAEAETAAEEGRLVDFAQGLAQSFGDGRLKLFVTSRLLRLRRESPTLFVSGSLSFPLARGEAAERAFALERTHGEQRLVACVSRLIARGGGWGDTWLPLPELPEGRDTWRELFTGTPITPERREGKPGVSLGGILAVLPVAVLL